MLMLRGENSSQRPVSRDQASISSFVLLGQVFNQGHFQYFGISGIFDLFILSLYLLGSQKAG